MRAILLLVAALSIPVTPGHAQAQTGSKVVVPGTGCNEGACSTAPPAVYACLAAALTPDPVMHGRLFEAMQRLERNPSFDAAEPFRRLIEQPACGASAYRIQLVMLRAVTDRTPFLRRSVTTTGLLMQDQANNIRVQLPDGSYPWIIDPAGLDPSLVGSAVTVKGITTGARRLRVVSMSKTGATAAIMAPGARADFIWCRTVGERADTVYSSTVFPGDYLEVHRIARAFGEHVERKYGYRSRYSAACMFDRYIQKAFLRLRSSNRDTTASQRRVVETEWRYNP